MSSSPRQLRRAYLLGLVLFVAGVLSVTVYALWRLRSDAIANGLHVSALHARNFESFLTQSLRVTEQMAANVAPDEKDVTDLQRIQATFVTSLRQTPFLRSMSLQDKSGRILVSSNPANVGLIVSTQNYLPPASDTQEIMRLGQPWRGRDFATGQVTTPQTPAQADAQGFIPVTRALNVGGRVMTLLIAINPDYFINHMVESLGTQTGSVILLRYDGILMLGTATDARAGTSYAQLVQSLHLASTESGSFEQPSAGTPATLTAFRASVLYPFVVVTQLDHAAALQTWRTEAKTLMGALSPALLVIILLGNSFYRRQMEAAAQRDEADRLLRINATVFDTSSEAIIITDAHANIISINAACTRMTGYTEQEVLGCSPCWLTPALQDKAFYDSLLAKILQTGTWQEEMVNHRKDGTPFDAHFSISVSRDGQGRLQHYIAVIEDITARKQAQRTRDEALNRLNRIASRVPGVLYEFRLRPDGHMSFPYASDPISVMYGNRITPQDVQQDASKVFALIHPDDLAGVSATIQQSAAKLMPWHHEYRVKFDDGTVRWLLGSAVPEREADGAVLWHGFISDITERKQDESKVFELHRDFVSFLDNTSDFIYFKDKDSRFRFASQTLADITGHAHWRDMIGKHDLEVFPAETAQIYQEEEFPVFRDGVALLNKVDPYFDAAGNRGWVSTSKWPLFDSNGQVEGLFGISRDITTHKQNEAKLELAASVFNNSREGIMITQTDGTIVDVNEAFSRITGYGRDEIVGQNPRILKSGRQSKDHYAAMWQGLIEKGHWYGEVWNRRKSGEVYAEMQTISTVRDAQGKPQHYVALFSDITVAKEHELQLDHIAHYDTLTNLPNRVLLADRLSQSMAQAQRRGMQLAVVFLDLDGFKIINDTHGHEAGDHLLMALASRMKQALREGDTMARIGGDEFVAVLVDLGDASECLPIVKRLLNAAAEPTRFADVQLQVSASLGVTFYPQDGEMDADQLQRQADQAMYQAKVAGKNRYHFFDAEHDRNVRGQHENIEHIRCALLDGEFALYYQPKVNMRTAQIVGAEALIRWQHPERGLLTPGLFLPVIENHPLAVAVGEWVMHQALAQMQAWHQAGLDMPVSVNVGARQLQQHDFVARLQAILAEHPGIRPGCLELEVLETSALEDIAGVSKVIQACRDLGVTFALDDFGTGYSSLTYLKRLPVSRLKIDQSFVCDMLGNPDDLAILQGVIGLAKAFHREVIAEGVETLAHGTALLHMGCELAQGYGIARPMPAQEFPLWVKRWHSDPIWLGASSADSC